MDIKRFGYDWLTRSHANYKYKQKINIYIVIYYSDINTKELKELPLSLLSKEFLSKTPLGDRDFQDAYNQLVMQKVFPHSIVDVFYYTDNRTVIPKAFLPVIENKEPNQLTLQF